MRTRHVVTLYYIASLVIFSSGPSQPSSLPFSSISVPHTCAPFPSHQQALFGSFLVRISAQTWIIVTELRGFL